MKLFITLLISSMPFFSLSQGYQIPISNLKQISDGSTKKINIDPNKELDFNKEVTLTEAVIEITGLNAGEDADIQIKWKDDNSKIIDPEPLDGNGNLQFHVKDIAEKAKGKFEIFYKGKTKGFCQFKIINISSNDGSVEPEQKNITDYVGVMANANFVGNNKFLSNLTPIVTLGIITPLIKKNNFSWSLDVNPYLGAQIDAKDSVSFIPSLMLPARAGLILNNYLNWSLGNEEKVKLTWMPLGFGLKVIPSIKDSNTVIFQHNFRTGFAIGYSDIFLMGVQYTHGFHNTTSESKRYYKAVFGNNSTDIRYLTLSGQFYIKSGDASKSYLYFEWRGLASKRTYQSFSNTSILTIGYRSDLSLTHIFAASSPRTRKSSAGRLSAF